MNEDGEAASLNEALPLATELQWREPHPPP